MSTERKNLSTSKLEIYLKRNMSGEEIAKKLGFASLNEMDEAMKIGIPSSYSYYHSRLFKKASRKQKAANKATAQEPKVQEPKTQEENPNVEEDTRQTLEELIALEQSQQIITAECEVTVKNIRQEAREELKRIQGLKEKIDEWRLLIEKASEEIDSLEEKSLSILANHEDALAKLHEEQQSLSEIREKIAERTKIFIMVDGKNGIDAEQDGKAYELEFGEWRSIYESIISRGPELLGDLRINEVVQVAKILSLPDGDYDIIFEYEELENLYNSMKGA